LLPIFFEHTLAQSLLPLCFSLVVTPPDPDNDGISLLEDYNDLSLLENYNDLVYFVQTSLGTSGIEELDDWGKTEEFYIELISRLCFIDTILITKIKSLEYKFHPVYKEYIAASLDISFSYPGEFLFWSNGEMWWELSYFFNNKL
jgi:hypothetical protein